MTHHFCCYCDHNYLSRVLAMHASLKRHCADFRLHVLTLSNECSEILVRLNIPEIEATDLLALENRYPELHHAKQNRTWVEYIFTLSPVWPLYLFEVCRDIDQITYLDGDLWFFSDPAAVFEEIGRQSIAIVPHRFAPALKAREKYGIYNVGWLTFRRDEDGFGCLQWWKERCIEWCYDRVDDGRFADQGYLNDWPERFRNVAIVENPGVNAAPWNINAGVLNKGQGADAQVTVDGKLLIFFHFQGMRKAFWRIYDSRLRDYGVASGSIISHSIYGPYIAEVNAIEQRLHRQFPTLFIPQRIGRTGKQSIRNLLQAFVRQDLYFAAA